eukprot:16428096-Heterocapsa_arctica.AAC.1
MPLAIALGCLAERRSFRAERRKGIAKRRKWITKGQLWAECGIHKCRPFVENALRWFATAVAHDAWRVWSIRTSTIVRSRQ